jgi:serine/threonine protein phosphatase 1
MAEDTVYFAIGDVHGESGKLARLHDAVLARIAAAGAPAAIVHLGDYVDRGPDSRGVIDRILALEADARASGRWEVVSLLGNHEQMMLTALLAPDAEAAEHWTRNGGAEALKSYGATPGDPDWRSHAPAEHLAFLRRLKTLHLDPARRLAFVHAGIDPATFPACSDDTRVWTRSPRFMADQGWPDRPELDGLTVVHGHTPTPEFAPVRTARRINVDTGACYGGPLTAVVLAPGAEPEFIRVA